MKKGEFADGAHVLRAKIDMASPNINLRDPGDLPHPQGGAPPHRRQVVHLPDVHLRPPIEDALEKITHSLCTSSRGPAAFSTTGCWRRSPRAPARAAAAEAVEFARLNLNICSTEQEETH